MIDTKALREKVLDLAIRGKLVPQDPNDEPATVLLERIREQKKHMVKEGKLKAKDIKNDTIIFKGDDNLHYEQFADGTVKCIEDEIPFDVPDGWAWERLSNIASFSGGKTPSTSHREYWDGDILWVTSKDMKSKYINSSLLMISEKGLEQMQLFPERTLLLVTRSGILRHSIPVAILEKSATINQDLKAIMPYFPNLEEYLYICIKGMESRLIMEYTKAGATVENINFDALKKILLPVPPKNQIPKVIDAANEAEEVISQLELSQSDLIETISRLKSKILDLAIQGKLVPQNPDDEPASVLLDRIRAEKEELIKAGKIKRDKKESVIFKGDDNSYYEKVGNNIKNIDDKIPFEIPENWHWERLGNICTISRGGSPRPITDYLTTKSTGINWIKIGDAEQGGKYIYSTREKIIPEGLPKTRYVKSGDFLLTNSMSFGRPYILKTDGCIHDGWLVIGDIDNVFNQDFLYYALSSSFMYNSFREVAAGSTVKNLKSDTVRSVLFPVPPLKEQERISKYLENLYFVVSTIEQCLS